MSEKQPIDNFAHARRPPTAMYSVIGHYTESPSLQSSNLYQFPPTDAQGDTATFVCTLTLESTYRPPSGESPASS